MLPGVVVSQGEIGGGGGLVGEQEVPGAEGHGGGGVGAEWKSSGSFSMSGENLSAENRENPGSGSCGGEGGRSWGRGKDIEAMQEGITSSAGAPTGSTSNLVRGREKKDDKQQSPFGAHMEGLAQAAYLAGIEELKNDVTTSRHGSQPYARTSTARGHDQLHHYSDFGVAAPDFTNSGTSALLMDAQQEYGIGGLGGVDMGGNGPYHHDHEDNVQLQIIRAAQQQQMFAMNHQHDLNHQQNNYQQWPGSSAATAAFGPGVMEGPAGKNPKGLLLPGLQSLEPSF